MAQLTAEGHYSAPNLTMSGCDLAIRRLGEEFKNDIMQHRPPRRSGSSAVTRLLESRWNWIVPAVESNLVSPCGISGNDEALGVVANWHAASYLGQASKPG
jgi:hypothetical protein